MDGMMGSPDMGAWVLLWIFMGLALTVTRRRDRANCGHRPRDWPAARPRGRTACVPRELSG